jgi:hypothetical protein
MTDDEIITLGIYCEGLMRDEQFNLLCEMARKNLYNEFLASAPHETKKREGIYHDVWGLQSFLGLLHTHVQARDRILQASEEYQERLREGERTETDYRS